MALPRKPAVTCSQCGYEWYGASAARALATVGSCIRCKGGELRFSEDPVTEVEQPLPAFDKPAHLVLGSPRL